MQRCVDACQRSPLVLVLRCLTPKVLRHDLAALVGLGVLELQAPPLLHPSARSTAMSHHAHHFKVGSGDQTETCISRTELSLLVYHLLRSVVRHYVCISLFSPFHYKMQDLLFF